VDSLCHLWFTTTNLSYYRFPIFETSATALCGTTVNYQFLDNQYLSWCSLHSHLILVLSLSLLFKNIYWLSAPFKHAHIKCGWSEFCGCCWMNILGPLVFQWPKIWAIWASSRPPDLDMDIFSPSHGCNGVPLWNHSWFIPHESRALMRLWRKLYQGDSQNNKSNDNQWNFGKVYKYTV